MHRHARGTEPIIIEATAVENCDSADASACGSYDASGTASAEDADATKARGAKQLIAGSAIAAIGVPMLILPGPGVAAIAGGVALAAKGYSNMTGKDVIDEETRTDPEFVAGQAAGERFAERIHDFAADELAPAGHAIAHDLKEAGSAAAAGIGRAAVVAASVAGHGLEAAMGEQASAKARDFAQRNVAPIAEAAASFGHGIIEGIKPHAAHMAHAGSQAAADAAQKLADKTRDMMR